MTNQDAIERIQSIKSKVSLYVDVLALIMAEESLESQKTGHWIDREVYDADRWKCSECGRTEQYKENYCPNCGAKMEGE